ncbi:MAG: hypothetical protein AAGM16_08970 [Pseudomonadota bacterium]
MIRFMGFATGAAVAVGFMLFLFGAPQAPDVEPEPAVEPPQLETHPIAAEAPEPLPPSAAPIVEHSEVAVEREAEVTPAQAEAPTVENITVAQAVEATPDVIETSEPATRIAVADDAPPRDLQWHAFWSPFRSRIAANGFISRLESVTGFDYRVVQIDSGVYEVAVGYASDDERRNKLAAIAEATGLEMPDS